MKLNHREAQRNREIPLHQLSHQPGAAGIPQPIVTAAPQKNSALPVEPTEQTSRNLFQRFQQWLTQCSEPQITLITDHSGQTWWKVYNPRTQTLQWLDSETEVRLWLDNQPEF